MISINLLPEEMRKTKKVKKKSQANLSALPLKKIIIIAVTLVVLFQVSGGLILYKKGNTLKKLEKEIKFFDSDYKVAQTLKAEMNELKGKLSAINDLTSNSILWSEKMFDLSFAMTEGIWLNSLSLSDRKGTKGDQVMVLSATAVSEVKGGEAALIGAFISSLKTKGTFFGDFKDVKLESSLIRQIVDLDVMDFKVLCYFNSGRSYFDPN